MLTHGNLGALAGVYTISFLAVMALFGVGNILLKVRRARLPRPTIARWPSVLIAIVAVLSALVGNALLNPAYLRVFLGEAYPDIDIEYVEVEGEFGPELIEKLSKKWKIPTNFMFIGSPGDHFPYRLEELGGVRLII